MRTTLAAILAGMLVLGCSGDKGSEPNYNLTFELNTSLMYFSSVEKATWPLTAGLTLKNVDADSIQLTLIESCDWLSTSKTKVKLASGETAPVTVTISMKNLREGAHDDTIQVVDYGNGGLVARVAVTVVATADSTYAVFTHPTSSYIYLGEYQGAHCYRVTSAWYVVCHSNSGNPVRLFAYEAWSGEKMAEDYFAERSIAPGDSLRGSISFDGCTTSPPPLSAYWFIKVGYRIGSQEHWLVHNYY